MLGGFIASKRGFTLVELVGVVFILIILSAIILPIAFEQIRKARVSRMISEGENLRRATLAYYIERGRWPYRDEVDGAIKELLTRVSKGIVVPKGPYLDKAPRQRDDGRFASQYGGLLMLDDVDDGRGDDSDADRNNNGLQPERFVYQGQVPVEDARLLDLWLDGQLDASAGTVVRYSGDDWTTKQEGRVEVLYIFSESF